MYKLFKFLLGTKDSNFYNLISKGANTFLFKVASLSMAYLLLLVITHEFGAEVYGRYSIALTLAQLLVMIFTFGLPNYIVKLIADINYFENKPKQNYLKKAFFIIIVSGLLVAFIFFYFSDFIAVEFFKDKKLTLYIKGMSYFLLPFMLHEFITNFFRGKKDFLKYNLFSQLLPYIAFFILFYILINLFEKKEEFSLFSYMGGVCMILIIELALFFKLKYKTKVDFPIKKLLSLSIPMMFSTAFLFLINWTDIFMLGALVSSKEVGIYNVAFKIASLGYLVIIAINIVIAPKIAELYSKQEFRALKKLIHQSTLLITVLTLPLVLLIVVFRFEILGFFGVEFLEGDMALILIVSGVFFSAISGNVDQILNMTNGQKVLTRITIFCFFINLVLNYLLIPKYGINGAALASLVTNIILNMLCNFYIKRNLGYFTFY